MLNIELIMAENVNTEEKKGEPVEPMEPKEKKESQYLNIRQYLDQTVIPILLQGLAELAKERYSYHQALQSYRVLS